jgi:ribonuclease BN (tRNA processing enzyme)
VKLTVVGSGTAAPTADRVCAGFFVESAESRILLDCGPGVVHQMARLELPWPRLDHVLLTHFHNDHVGDLPFLLFALRWGLSQPRTARLDLWGPVGTGALVRRLARALGSHVIDPGFPLRIHDLQPDETATVGDAGLHALRAPHTDTSLAFRIRSDGASLGYTGDTGPSEAVARFLAGVDLLVAECSLPDDEAMDSHLTPSRLAAMASLAAPRRLLVTHVYPQLAGRDVPGLLAAAGWTGETLMARDGLELDVGPRD